MAAKPTVYVVDDDPGALRSLCWLIQQADLPVQAFSSGQEFLNSCDPQAHGCLVLDIRMPGMDGLEVQRQLAEHGIRMPVIFLTGHGDVPTCAEAFRGGAFHFLEKPVDDALLLEHIHKALAHCAEHIRGGAPAEFAARSSQLTPREKGVMDMLLAGKSLKEIAAAGNVTVQTIWKHRASIFQKMAVENEVELVRVAMQWELERRR